MAGNPNDRYRDPDIEPADLRASYPSAPGDQATSHRDGAGDSANPHSVGNWREGQYDNDQFSAPSGKQGRCLLIGCAVIFVGGIFLILCAGFGGYRLYIQQVEKYTSTEPMKLPVVEYDEEQFTELETRLEEFKENVESLEEQMEAEEAGDPEGATGGLVETKENLDPVAVPSTAQDVVAGTDSKISDKASVLRLSADDINALIAREEDLKQRVFVRIEDGKVKGDLSFPLDKVLPRGEGRFFNGSAAFDIQWKDGELFIGVEDVELNGEKLPQHLVDEIEKQNFAEELIKDPQVKTWIEQFEKVEVDGDQLIVEVKRVASQSTSD